MTRPTLVLTVGLPAAGKTTVARRLAAELPAVRLTPDEWMKPLFNASDVDGARDVLEGRLLWTALEVVRCGGSVVVDFGCWSAEERWAIRWMAEDAGASFRLVHCEVDEAERRRRATQRFIDAPETTFEMTDAMHDEWYAVIERPSRAELDLDPIPAPPQAFVTWGDWAAERWPSLRLGG